jgi:hypothetical protein
MPVPVVLIVPGYRISVQVPVAGNPLRRTLPVVIEHEGAVIVPTAGAGGIGGCEFIITFPLGGETHPVELVTEKVYVPDGNAVIVELTPVPEMVTPPGFLVSVHVPVAGNPLNTTPPVEIAHVGWVIEPTTGAVGADGAGAITASADAGEVHPSALVTINVKVPAPSPVMVVTAPFPLVLIAPGLRTSVQVPVGGNPVNTTLPVPTVHVRFVIAPIAGEAGAAYTVKVYVETAGIHNPPTGLFVVMVIITFFPASAAVGV